MKKRHKSTLFESIDESGSKTHTPTHPNHRTMTEQPSNFQPHRKRERQEKSMDLAEEEQDEEE